MRQPTTEEDFNSLIPEMQAWNDGVGIGPEAWISCSGSYQLAVGYSLIFWPKFALISEYVVRDGTTMDLIQNWEQATNGNHKAVEAVINHLHMADLHMNGSDPSEEQLRYIGRILKQIHGVKLRSEFPGRVFEVDFPDEPGLDALDYQLTFWQVRA